MEGTNLNKPEEVGNDTEKLSGKEKIDKVLELFGTNEAREKFIENCKDYIVARTKAIHESYSPDVGIRKRAITSGPKQAILHNKIMDAITRLANQAPNVSPLQRAILIEMFDRDVTAEYIKEYVVSIDRTIPNEDDEEEGNRKKGMSDTAYYHSLGKEH